MGGGRTYERKVDLPQSGSPRRRMETVGGSSMNGSLVVVDFHDVRR